MSKYILPTYTGKLFDLENPTEDMICIEDIAHHLSLENRYNGATKFPYSVAQHSLHVCAMAPDNLKLEALLHDAAEAYCKDLTSPLKNLLRYQCTTSPSCQYYVDFNIMQAIIDKFDLQINLYEENNIQEIIKEIDLRMASTEILLLIYGFPTTNWQHLYDKYPHYAELNIYEMLPSTVEQMFKEEYQKWRRD